MNGKSRLAINLFSVINSDFPDSMDYHIAEFILKNINNLEILDISSLADRCSVSKASVSRFCKRIGLNSFFDLKAQISEFHQDISFKFSTLPEGDAASLRIYYLDELIRNMEKIRNSMGNPFFDELTSDLLSGKHVVAMGHMQSGDTALKLQHQLFGVGKVIQVLTQNSEQKTYFENGGKEDILVIFSVTGNFFRNLFGRDSYSLHAQRPKTYFITTNSSTFAKAYVDRIYNCRTGQRLPDGNICLDVVADLIFISYWYAKSHKSGKRDEWASTVLE